MFHRARILVGCLVAAFVALAMSSIVAAQPTSRPAENFDARPFPIKPSAGASGFPTSQPIRPAASTFASLGFDVGRMFAALLIVLALIGLAYWAARRIAGRNAHATATRAVKVLSRTPLAPRQQVMLLQVGKRVIVVGESGGQMSSLAQIDDADEVAQLLGQIEGEQMRRATSFGGVFRRSQKAFDEPIESPGTDAGVPIDAPATDLSDIDQQRSELSGLLDKVRALRGQIDK